MKIAGIVLAAGESKRMVNKNKLLLKLDGKTIIYKTVEAVKKAGFDPIYVVIGYEGKAIQSVLGDIKVTFVKNPDWRSGMASSIIAGIHSLPKKVRGTAIILGDMPLLSIPVLKKLISTFKNNEGRKIIYPIYQSQQGNPVIFPKRFFSIIEKSVKGDRGCQGILKSYPTETIGINTGSIEVSLDCDTEEHYSFIKGILRKKEIGISSRPLRQNR